MIIQPRANLGVIVAFPCLLFQQKSQKRLADNQAVVRQCDLLEMRVVRVVIKDTCSVARVEDLGHDLFVELRVALHGEEFLGHVHALDLADG